MNPEFMREAIRLSVRNLQLGRGGPFGAVVVHNGKIVGRGANRVTSTNDPTAHAEMGAIRQASKRLQRFHLDDCELYTSCEPCPMCLAAVYWARIGVVYYGNTRRDAAEIEFNDDLIYRELSRPIKRRKIRMEPLLRDEARKAFEAWTEKADRVAY